MAPPVAVITGASSGMGLALTKHLLERKWNVAMADINPPKDQLDNTIFVKTDVSNWNQQAELFQKTYEKFGRLDFVALNAGIVGVLPVLCRVISVHCNRMIETMSSIPSLATQQNHLNSRT